MPTSVDRDTPRAVPAVDVEHLAALEAEAIFILREVVAESERPALLFSGGKDSIVMLHLAQKAFAPARIPFPLVHVDTGHNFTEVLELRDKLTAELEAQLIVGSVQEAIDSGLVAEPDSGMRNAIQTPVLLQTIERHRLTALFGGARRDEEKARAKERVVSFRDDFGQWNPKSQRPELWSLYNSRIRPGESIRVFPLSNWTELDIWHYIQREDIELPALYYAHERSVVNRDGMLFAVHEHLPVRPGEEPYIAQVRYRTIGDSSCTAAVGSGATTAADVIQEILTTRLTERGATRGDDRVSDSAMEDRKREGYF
ncbi:sulfate adenylyltransferase subunit CysD [Streptomyces tendae]|uniref:Sulfate adenylyltransferase subunit 2 n=1 Tax=Streptomyces tendae TaxID=1932 RepID=A0A6B3QTX4_STRTE|nr:MULTISPECIES: sulfate adenylyltransferase subunit CysD [Streptomyces]MBQ0968661.1 sulfate adenylyltransferase subunit CysD [Streptomyces sp. RK74B]MBQ1008666.1 sulfate adenylyltransferase subunit CysD [Streptomyces sp. RK23]MZG15465.1 sulfate adenylyltransferase subunit CysD [Streptomyces sp. SID5914]NEV89885.1 sulfate adenylyltransferase subunit CysD [Streptomyces tendae]